MLGKGASLLAFLKDAATLRRQRVPSYRPGDELLWFADVPKDRRECRSALLSENPEQFPEIWLEVRKKRMPTCPPVPEMVLDWVRPEDLDQTQHDPELLPEITLLVERQAPDPDAPPEQQVTMVTKVPELQHLSDHPEVEEAWLDYLVNKWEPWAEELRRWEEVQRVYEKVDLMRRRLEESEERYELLLAVGLLQWRDSTGKTVKRHLLTAPAEISLDAARGVLTVLPSASFQSFRIELDMLELHEQPRIEGAGLEDRLEELDIQAWDTAKVGEILSEIANRATPSAEVDEKALRPADRADETVRVLYAPAVVLRERRPTAYEELIAGFLKGFNGDVPPATTGPWDRFVSEGESLPGSSDPTISPPHYDPTRQAADRLLFPLPTNDEQRRIAHRLGAQPYVLVKGPPGTGKSQTIANMICHLLASGERVLVTAHTAKALTVLRGLLPDDLRDLCVTALGSTRDDQRLLDEGVHGILRRHNEWQGPNWAQEKIKQLEQELNQLEDKRAEIDRELRESREAETHSCTLLGGYQGTTAQIARRLEQERESFGWLPHLHDDLTSFPLGLEDIRLLAEVHAQATQDWCQELRLETGEFQLADPDDFAASVSAIEAAEDAEERALRSVVREKLDVLRDSPVEGLEKSRAFLTALDEHAARARRSLGELAQEVLRDLLVGRQEHWKRLARDVDSLLSSTATTREELGTAQVQVPAEADHKRLLEDASRRLEHFEKGRRRGFWIFSPRVVRQTRYVEESCRVEGRAPRRTNCLRKLVAFLGLEAVVENFAQTWPTPLSVEHQDPRKAADDDAELLSELSRLLSLFMQLSPASFGWLPVACRNTLAEQNERVAWLSAIQAETAIRGAHAARQPLDHWLGAIRRCLDSGRGHDCMSQLADAAEKRLAARWQEAWETREHLRSERERLRCYEALLTRLDRACPGLKTILRSTEGDPEWGARLRQLDKAWAWAGACGWLRDTCDPGTYRERVQSAQRLQPQIEKKTAELAALRAWHAFFERLDDVTLQNLTAWRKAVDRIGKGTGKHAYRHRNTARQYMMACIPMIPAWVMPLHKLWETTKAHPGLFDTVIVDEASQAGIESLALLLLARQVVVVGDDKQNSPEAVGVLEQDIARLAHQHLIQFRFRAEFRPDTSLFDHAERAFGNPISLREHFRCVPEIIRFSNDLCYTDSPLIPLRQPPPNRLSPLKSTYVRTGACQGDGQRIHNRAEAEAVVQAIRSCIANPAYEDKTMGVIALQGHAQAERIGSMLAQELDSQVIEQRKLRCGVPATFQGDERDIMFLSLVIAPKVQYRALGRLPDQRRFNVAMSRARDQVWLFHSVQQHDLNPECLRRRLLGFFQSPGHEALDRVREDQDRLEREARRPSRQRGDQPEPYESWFEVDVALELLRRKYAARPQYEVASKRIDLVVQGLDARLAVECDGDTWHGPEKYDQDMARQRQLERAGWTFVRIRESEFYADRAGAVQAILEACEVLGIQPLDRLDQTEQEQSPPKEGAQVATVVRDDDSTTDLDSAEDESTGEELVDAQDGPFTGYSEACGFPDPREASAANVRIALRRIIEGEGPLTRASVYRLYVEGCPHLYRAGKAVRQALNHALGAMLRSGEVVQEDELHDRSPGGQVVRLADAPKVRERPAGRRDLPEIPPSELLLLLDRVSPLSPARKEDEETLCRKVLDHYGFNRLTTVRRRLLARILELHRSSRGQPGTPTTPPTSSPASSSSWKATPSAPRSKGRDTIQ